MMAKTPLEQENAALRERVVELEKQLAEQRQSLSTLRASEQRLHAVLNNLPDAPYRRNLRTDRYDYFSPVIEQLVGWTVEEMSRTDIETVLAWIYPNDLPQIQQEIERTLTLCQIQSRATAVLEYRFQTKMGDYRWLEDNLTVIAGDDGQPLYRVGTIRDITERKQAEDKLHQSEQKYNLLFEKSIVPAVLLKLPEVVIVDGNEAFEKLCGYTRQEMMGKTLVELGFVRREERAQIIAKFGQQRALEGQETRIFTKSGEERLIIINTTPLELDGQNYALSLIQDITEGKQVEARLHEAETLYQTLFELSLDGLSVFDAAMNIVTANRRAAQLYGYESPEAMVGENAFSFVVQEEQPQAREKGQDRQLNQGLYNEYRLRRKDGSLFIGETGSISIPDSNGQPSGLVLGVVRDITERKRAEEELYRTLEELRRSNAELEQFAYISSHDLQEPLRAVAGMMQLLQQRYRGRLDEYADEYIELAVEGAKRMQSLINDLLIYSRVGRRSKPVEPVNAGSCLQTALQNLKVAIAESQAIITHDDLPSVTADSTQLTQLFQNLIGNGLKFRSDQPPQIHISAVKVANSWQFSVRDNGIGIEPQYFERIFQVFQRLHTRDEYPGTGLGLALCQKIVERYGGTIWVESSAGQGSTFYFTLP